MGFVLQQVLAVIRTFVLARLLTPEDFGLVGLVTVTLFAGIIFTELNIESALVQKPEASKRFLHTAWTLSILRGLILAGILQIGAPWIARTFGQPEATPFLRVGALSFVLVVLPIVPSALLVRELRYRSRVLLDIFRELATVSVCIILGFWLRNGWALLLGVLSGQAVTAIGIWFTHEYRPRWILDRESLSSFWRFGTPLYVSGLMTYLVTRGDDLAVSKFCGLVALGKYQVIFGIAEMLTRGVSDILSRVAFPAYSRMVVEGRDLKEGFQKVWTISVLVMLPITGAVFVFSSQLIQILLGSQWISVAPVLSLLIVAEALRAFAVPFGTIILASGRTEYLSRIKFFEAATFAVVILPLTIGWGLVGAATTLIIVYTVCFVGSAIMANKVASILRPVVYGIAEPLFLIGVSGFLAGIAPAPDALMTFVLLFVWMLFWAIYVFWRHSALVAELWSALHKG